MVKKEAFKNFIKTKPELVGYVEKGEMTWQKFFELYDIYGEDEKIWSKYKGSENRNSSSVMDGISKITNMVKNVDMDSIKNHINSAQKALDLVQDLTSKKSNTPNINSLSKGPAAPRPLNKFFED